MAVGIPGTPDELLSVAEAAEVMGVSDAHVRRVIGSGGLAAKRVGARTWLIRRADAEAWAAVERRTDPQGSTKMILTYADVREWNEHGESRFPSIPSALLQIAFEMVDRGGTGGFTDATGCRFEVETERVTFWIPTAAPERATRITYG